jgi:hypothetical protein
MAHGTLSWSFDKETRAIEFVGKAVLMVGRIQDLGLVGHLKCERARVVPSCAAFADRALVQRSRP